MQIPEEILTIAKETVLRFGGYQPTLFVIGTKTKVYTHLPLGENALERVENMKRAGVQLAKQCDFGELQQVIFVSEGWASPARTNVVLPSQDPNRREVLLINALDVPAAAQTLEVYDVVRDTNQAVIDVKPFPLPEKGRNEVASMLLPSFVTGYRLVKK